MQLSLAVSKDNKVVEAERIAWSRPCCSSIMPPREPDMENKGVKGWVIAPDKRGAFLTRVDKVLDGAGVPESLYGFFAIVGIDSRWFEDADTAWTLVYSLREIKVGSPLKAQV